MFCPGSAKSNGTNLMEDLLYISTARLCVTLFCVALKLLLPYQWPIFCKFITAWKKIGKEQLCREARWKLYNLSRQKKTAIIGYISNKQRFHISFTPTLLFLSPLSFPLIFSHFFSWFPNPDRECKTYSDFILFAGFVLKCYNKIFFL